LALKVRLEYLASAIWAGLKNSAVGPAPLATTAPEVRLASALKLLSQYRLICPKTVKLINNIYDKTSVLKL